MRYEVEEAVATFVRGLFQGATSVVPACLSTNVMGDRHGRTFVLKVVEGVAPVLYLTQAFGDEKTSPPHRQLIAYAEKINEEDLKNIDTAALIKTMYVMGHSLQINQVLELT